VVAPTSTIQFEAVSNGTLPRLEQLRDGVWSVALPVKARFSTLCYLVEDERGGVHVIDPGMDSSEAWALLESALHAMGRGIPDVSSITVTHLHADHMGMANRLRTASGAPLVMHRLEQTAIAAGRETIGPELMDQWGVPDAHRAELMEVNAWRESLPKLTSDSLVDDGDLLAVPGRSIRVIWTPGHTRGHVCLRLENEGLLLTGDHVLPAVSSGLGLGGTSPTNPLADYLASLAVVAPFDDDEAAPGHGYRFRGLAERCSDLAALLRDRSREIGSVLDSGPLTIWEVASRVAWRSGFDRMRGSSLTNALFHTAMHVSYLGREQELEQPSG
jgi:glyoxylase-like metal-dependent hydrolase (beta-lactamase superfamily II)